MNTIRDKHQNIRFGLNLEQSAKIISKEAEKLAGKYNEPLLVKAATGEMKDVFVSSPLEHINFLKNDAVSNDLALDIRENQGYTVNFKFAKPIAEKCEEAAEYMQVRFKDIKEALHAVTVDSINYSRTQLRQKADKLVVQKTNLNKTKEILVLPSDAQKFSHTPDELAYFGIKPELIEHLAKISPADIKFKFKIINAKDVVMNISSTKYFASEPVAKTFSIDSTSVLSKVKIENIENKILKISHEANLPMYNARLAFTTAVDAKKPKGMEFNDDIKKLVLNSKTITAEQAQRFADLAVEPKLKGLTLFADTHRGDPSPPFISSDSTEGHWYRSHFFDKKDKISDDSQEFYQAILKKFENVDDVVAEKNGEFAEYKAYRKELKKMKDKVVNITKTEEYETKFPPYKGNNYSNGIIQEAYEIYNPKFLNHLIKNTDDDLVFLLSHNSYPQNYINFYVGSKANKEAGYGCLFHYPERSISLIGGGEIEPENIIKGNLTAENLSKFKEEVLKVKALEKREANELKALLKTEATQAETQNADRVENVLPVEEIFDLNPIKMEPINVRKFYGLE